jgi:hypothetical protein
VRASRDLVGKDSPMRRSRLLMFRWDRRCVCCMRTYSHGQLNIPLARRRTRSPAHHQGSARGRRFIRRHSWDFRPSQVCSRRRVRSLFPNSRACMPFADRSPRFIFVAEPSVQRGNRKRKRTGDHESSVRLPGFNSRHRSALWRISLRSSAILPWALPLSGLRASEDASAQARPRAQHQPL